MGIVHPNPIWFFYLLWMFHLNYRDCPYATTLTLKNLHTFFFPVLHTLDHEVGITFRMG